MGESGFLLILLIVIGMQAYMNYRHINLLETIIKSFLKNKDGEENSNGDVQS